MVTRPTGSIATIAGTAVGIVLGCAVLFGVLGVMRSGDSPDPAIADGPAASEQASNPSVAAPTDAASQVAPEPADTASEPDAVASAQPTADPAPSPEPTVVASAVTPGDVTVQVLDATGTGNSTTAQRIADELREAGYNVLVVNRASKLYEQTTVFWSEGQDAAGQQIAREFSFPKAERTPDEVRLSDKVNVHVVVGTDQL